MSNLFVPKLLIQIRNVKVVKNIKNKFSKGMPVAKGQGYS